MAATRLSVKETITPYRVSLLDFLSAWARPFSRNQCRALAKSPPEDSRAFLQSLIGDPKIDHHRTCFLSELLEQSSRNIGANLSK